jgi:hypothetical protein
MPVDEKIVDEAEVAEYLGVAAGRPVAPDIARATVVKNIGVFNAFGDRWIHARDLLSALVAFADNNDLPILRDVARQIAEGTNTRFEIEVRI